LMREEAGTPECFERVALRGCETWVKKRVSPLRDSR
jgi:hypothetical protein